LRDWIALSWLTILRLFFLSKAVIGNGRDLWPTGVGMPIRVQCGQCGATFTAADKLEGKRGKCPKCSAPLIVPKASGSLSVEPTPRAAVATNDREHLINQTITAPQRSLGERKGRLFSRWVLVGVLVVCTALVVGYLAGRYTLVTLRRESQQRADRIASLEQALTELKKDVASAESLAQQVKSLQAQRSQADEQLNREWEAKIDRECKLAIGDYIERWRAKKLRVALGLLDDRDQTAVRNHLEKINRGEKLSGSEYSWLYMAAGGFLAYEFASQVDWSDMIELHKELDATVKRLGLPSSHELATRLVNANSREDRLLLIYEYEAAHLTE
jgi:Tfp pilus assembly protein PilN